MMPDRHAGGTVDRVKAVHLVQRIFYLDMGLDSIYPIHEYYTSV